MRRMIPPIRWVSMAIQVCGEEAIQDVGGKIYIFRTSWVYSNIGTTSYLTMKKLSHERDELKVVAIKWGADLESIYRRANQNIIPQLEQNTRGSITWCPMGLVPGMSLPNILLAKPIQNLI